MIPKLEQELWIAQFAEQLIAYQPRFPFEIARSVAGACWEHMGIMRPVDAVQTILHWANEEHQQQPPVEGK